MQQACNADLSDLLPLFVQSISLCCQLRLQTGHTFLQGSIMPDHDYLILHGINLNMFGRRDPTVYGTATLEHINRALLNVAAQLGVRLDFFQTNHEGAMAERIHRALDDGTRGVVINAGAWTHYSYGLLDALNILSVPIVEVHMSHVASREEFRRHSVIAPACCGTVAGFGVNSYLLGLMALDQVVQEREQKLRRAEEACTGPVPGMMPDPFAD